MYSPFSLAPSLTLKNRQNVRSPNVRKSDFHLIIFRVCSVLQIYRSTTGKVNVTVVFNNGNLWLSQKRLSDLYAVDVSTINYHLKQINDTGELHLSDVIRKIQIPSEKWDEQGVLLYNLDAIIAVGYRVNSYEATQV